MHDLVIKNAVLVDGVGTPAFEGEIAVTGGKITAVGDGESVGEGRTRVDAEGLTLAPGIIDLHTHYGSQLFWGAEADERNADGASGRWKDNSIQTGS